jgi:hypothetical protein
MLVYGRDPSEQEIKLGIEYLHAEPMREFEENKNKPPKPPAVDAADGAAEAHPSVVTDAAKPMPDGAAVADAAAGADGAAPMGMGMMGGMGGFPGAFGAAGGRRDAGPAVPTTVKYDPSAWGRYAKVLFSSSEFLFIN